MDYGFEEPALVDAQEAFKTQVIDIMESYDIDPKAIAPSIRF